MIAEQEILSLSKVTLETKELLPEYAGIYYVIDENQLIWYIGKAKNLRNRVRTYFQSIDKLDPKTARMISKPRCLG